MNFILPHSYSYHLFQETYLFFEKYVTILICDNLKGYFLYLITYDDSDARFYNNLNIILNLNILNIVIKYIFSNNSMYF